MSLVWKPSVLGNHCYLGKYRVGGVFYSGLVSKGDPNKYKAFCELPGLKPVIGHYDTKEKAQQTLERAVIHWIKGAELNENQVD